MVRLGTALFAEFSGVAGVDAPAFVERTRPTQSRTTAATEVSPGLMPRPSLSVHARAGLADDALVSAGVDAPAFVERRLARRTRAPAGCVSPGLMPRPSLSDRDGRVHADDRAGVSPGLMPRPSLSDHRIREVVPARARVAGVDAPAFVERSLCALATSI